MSSETFTEKAVMLHDVVRIIAERMAANIPREFAAAKRSCSGTGLAEQ